MAEQPDISFIRVNEDADVGEKRNLASQAAHGRWIAHFDDDDIYAPDYLETMVSELLASRAPCAKLGDWLVCDLQRACWGEFLGRRPLEGRFAAQGAMRLLSHGFSLAYERSLALRFPFRVCTAAAAPGAGPRPSARPDVAGDGEGGEGGDGVEDEKDEEDEEDEDEEDEDTRVARALGRGSPDDLALLRRRRKEQERKEAGQHHQAALHLPFLEDAEDRDFLLRLLTAAVPIHIVHERCTLCVHVQHGKNVWGTVVHRWVPDPSSFIAGSRLGEVVPVEWLSFGSPRPLPPPAEDAQHFALLSWGVLGRPGHLTMLADEIREEAAQLAAHHARAAQDLQRRTCDISVRILELEQQAATCHKDLGNQHFRSGELDLAAACYRLALAATDTVAAFAHEVAGPLREKGDAVRYAVLCNLAQVAMKRGVAGEAEEHASAAIPLNREGHKAWWRRAQARTALGRPRDAAHDLLAAWRRAPEASQERTEIGRSLAQARQRGDLGGDLAAPSAPKAEHAEGQTGNSPPRPPRGAGGA